MTTEELTAIVVANSRAIAENTAAIAENTKSISQLTNSVLSLHDSIKSLEKIALAHDEAIDTLTKDIAALTREWQAYIKTLPRS